MRLFCDRVPPIKESFLVRRLADSSNKIKRLTLCLLLSPSCGVYAHGFSEFFEHMSKTTLKFITDQACKTIKEQETAMTRPIGFHRLGKPKAGGPSPQDEFISETSPDSLPYRLADESFLDIAMCMQNVAPWVDFGGNPPRDLYEASPQKKRRREDNSSYFGTLGIRPNITIIPTEKEKKEKKRSSRNKSEASELFEMLPREESFFRKERSPRPILQNNRPQKVAVGLCWLPKTDQQFAVLADRFTPQNQRKNHKTIVQELEKRCQVTRGSLAASFIPW